jgi:hypothetical protein
MALIGYAEADFYSMITISISTYFSGLQSFISQKKSIHEKEQFSFPFATIH